MLDGMEKKSERIDQTQVQNRNEATAELAERSILNTRSFIIFAAYVRHAGTGP
jgi:hypothetical protein